MSWTWMRALAGTAMLLVAVGMAHAQPADWTTEEVDIRAGRFGRIVSVSYPGRENPLARSSEAAAPADEPPRPPLAGFSPLVAIAASDEHSNEDLDFEHDLEGSYVGNPLNAPASANFVIGILDSGSVVDLVAGQSNTTLGLTGQYLTGNAFPIGGTGGTVDADLTAPIGFFAAGLGAVQPSEELDLGSLVGHSNVSVVSAPAIECGNGEAVTGIVGTPFLSFFTSVIRVDTPREVTVAGDTFRSPDVQLLDPFDPTIPEYPRSIAMEFGGYTPALTASYYPDLETLTTPEWPTMLSFSPLSFPLGGAFFATIGVREGEATPDNPVQNMRVLVDTGAQSSIISEGMVANLNLPQEPDFTVDICGVGGLVQGVPGYYVDYVKMNAQGGALEFSQAPFVVLDLESPEGGSLDGILGMNFFWNRNVVFEPSLSTSAFLHVSDAIAFAYGDFNTDWSVDQEDYDVFVACMTGPGVPVEQAECIHLDVDGDGDVDCDEWSEFLGNWTGPPVEPPSLPECASAVSALAWRSVRTHSDVGPLGITLDASASGEAVTSEPRIGGIRTLEVDFDGPVSLPGVAEVQNLTDGGSVPADGQVLVNGDQTLVLTFDPGRLADEKCYLIDLTGVVQGGGQPLAGDTDCLVRALEGDTDNNGNVELADAILAFDLNTQPVDESIARFDVDLNGNMELADAILAFDRNVNAANCP